MTEASHLQSDGRPPCSPSISATPFGIVVIGRNEGDRLRICLTSVLRQTDRIVYVDSGSSDGSVALADTLHIQTVVLTADATFTAARARNAGVAKLTALWPDLAFVQFIDGDCELDPDWIATAIAAMTTRSDLAAICGRRRERFPEHSIYNRLCDIEWDAPPGETESCGGDALMRIGAFATAGGFTDHLIAGEEADLCHRFRRHGWHIMRLPAEMTLHDVAMTRVSQWWRRNQRSGHAGAEAWHRRGGEDRRLFKPLMSNLLWALPILWPLWPFLWWRVFRRFGALYATHIVLGKLPHCAGQVNFWWSRLRARRVTLIEYK